MSCVTRGQVCDLSEPHFPMSQVGRAGVPPLPMGSFKAHVKDYAAQSTLEIIRLIICELSPHARPPDKSFHHKHVSPVKEGC